MRLFATMKLATLLLVSLSVSACGPKSADTTSAGDAPQPVAFIVNFSRATSEQEHRQIADSTERVALAALLANPGNYAGKNVEVAGVLNLELEGDQLCLDPGSLQYLATRNCLRLGLDEASLEKSRREIALWNGYYARIAGTFSPPRDSDHYGGYLAKAVNIDITATPVRPLADGRPVAMRWITHAEFVKRHPGYRFSPPTR